MLASDSNTVPSVGRTLSSSRINKPSSITCRKSEQALNQIMKKDEKFYDPQLPLSKPCHYGIYTSCTVLLGIVFCIVVKGLLTSHQNEPHYTGEYKGSMKHGIGTMLWPDGARYAGHWMFDQRDGRGKMQWPDGAEYVGQWKTGRRHGKGTFTTPKGDRYIGEYLNGVGAGQGTYTFPNGNQYIGHWKAGKMDGAGTFIEADGHKYNGQWVNGNLIGIKQEDNQGDDSSIPYSNSNNVGTNTNSKTLPQTSEAETVDTEVTLQSTPEVVQNFKAGTTKNGNGAYVWPDGTRYVGDWKDNKRHGKGEIVFSDGKSYSGDYLDGKMDGQGTYKWADGKSYVGEWKNNNKHGKGKLFDIEGNVILKGLWENDSFAA
eukprot:m.192312 g.192312  ORF g.192312 m.192312 type:complete len:373 (+) comp32460_c0_seq2:531-1649(+)